MRMRTMITAHSGAENTRDNTLESVRCLADCGADALEIDVNTQGDRLVLSHDHPAEGTACDTLAGFFAEMARHAGVWMNLDLKAADTLRPAADLAAEYGVADRILFSGDLMSADDIACARARGLTIFWNHTQIPENIPLLQGAADAGFDVLNAHYLRATDEMLQNAPERLSLWTVNDEAVLRRLLQAGVRNITTRCPLLALRLRKEIQGE